MPRAIHVRLLGGFGVDVDGAAIPDGAWRLRRSRSVLKVLALTPGRALHPERLQALLWPERDAATAGNNLRQAVYHARRALSAAGADGAAVLVVRGDRLTLEADVDVDAFEAAAERAERSGRRADLEAAVAAYGGELLPEDVYEPWAADRRRILAERHVTLLLALAAALPDVGAIEVLHRAVLADPLHEGANRALMGAYARAGRRPQALAQYEALRDALRRELGADPEPATRALYRELLAGGAPDAGAAAVQGRPPPASTAWQPTSFVGRTRELGELERLLAVRRLVTLTGPGGCGKTRLALAVAARRAGEAQVVELAALAHGERVGAAAAAALGLDLRPDEPADGGVAAHLADRELLLVLDNCEHVLAEAAHLVATVLAACPGVTVLATSREPLHLPGEVDWRVPSLGLLDPAGAPTVEQVAASDAARLFCDRAQTAQPRFALSAANAEAVASICFRLDGLPLAIELAAARTAALSPAQIAERLGDVLSVLGNARAGGLTRQQTLEGTLDWSHDALSEAERVLFRRLAVFSGGFSLEAAEAVAPGATLDADDVLGVLASLVDKSLVEVSERGDAYRYRQLEPVRQYAARRLHDAGEAAEAAERHAAWFGRLAAHRGGRVTVQDPDWIDVLDADHDNLRAALEWGLEHAPERALELGAGIAALWLLRAHLREGCAWLDRALQASPGPSAARGRALHARQALERRRPFNYDIADAMIQERVRLHAGAGDARGECVARLDLVDGTLLRGRFDVSLPLLEEASEMAAALGEPGLLGAVHERRGVVQAWRHELAAARASFERALELWRAAPPGAPPASAVISLAGLVGGDVAHDGWPVTRLEETVLHFRALPPPASVASVLSHCAYLSRAAGDHAAARAELDAALEVNAATGGALDRARLQAQRGMLELRAGDLDAAQDWLQRSLELRRRLREHRGTLLSQVNLGVLAAARGDEPQARERLDRARRMATRAADGPGLAAVGLAAAEAHMGAGRHQAALRALDTAVEAFYGRTGGWQHTTWIQLQRATIALRLDDFDAARASGEAARRGFAAHGIAIGLVHCDALLTRLRAANGALT